MKPNRSFVFILLLANSCIYDTYEREYPRVKIKKYDEIDNKSSVVVPPAVEASPEIQQNKKVVSSIREVDVIATSYCPCQRCCKVMSGRTSTGSNAWKPGIAVCPEAIPYGTKIHVPGYDRAEWAIADDTGRDMRKAWRRDKTIHIDVRMTYHWEARQWAKQHLRIKLIYPDGGE